MTGVAQPGSLRFGRFGPVRSPSLLGGGNHLGMKWQYKTFPTDSTVLTESYLNRLGCDAWELIVTTPLLIFKRQIVRVEAESPRAPQLKTEPRLLTLKEAAVTLGLGKTKINQLAASGQIPTVRIGTCVRVKSTDVDAWIKRITPSKRPF